MEFVLLRNFDNYIDAHIVKGRLEAEGIHCWLKDEHLSALIVDPVLTNAIAGIKLMVAQDHIERAIEVLNEPPHPLTEIQDPQ
ncbi:MAG: DUF2007 domain-containing protein [Chitinophagaceae bacterium]